MIESEAVSEDVARRRFLIIQAARIGGIACLLLGILSLNDAVRLPHALGYVLLAVGIAALGVLPVVLSKRWKSPRR